MDDEVIQAAKMAEIVTHSESVQIVSEDLQNVSPEIRDLLDIFAKQNKKDNDHVKSADLFSDDSTKKIGSDGSESLTLYATNDDGTAEPKVVQFNQNDAPHNFSTFFETNQIDVASFKPYQEMGNGPSHVKNSYPTFITPKVSVVSQDSLTSISNTSLVRNDAEISLDSSGYASASSPMDSIASSPYDSGSSAMESSAMLEVSRTFSPDPLSFPSPVPSPSTSISGNSMMTNNPYKIPNWVKSFYPELFQTWESISASEFYQGGVELLCSICKKNPYSGFHENLPVCEADRMGRACTVCRLRSASGFSYGLALCEADRLFLYRMFSQETKLERCVTLCPVTVQKWCAYCRFRTCLTTKGFRFFTETSTRVHQVSPRKDSRKRKFSGKGVLKELNFIPDTVAQDSVFIHNASSPGPGGFGCPTPAQAKQALGNYPAQTMAEANPALLQALSQPVSTPTQANLNQAASFAKPSFNLMPGLSKAEYASFQAGSSQNRAITPQASVHTPMLTPRGVESSAGYSQQQARAFSSFQQQISSQSRAFTSTPLPHPLNNKNLASIPNFHPQGRYGQLPPNMAIPHPSSASLTMPPKSLHTPMSQSSAHLERNMSMASAHPFANLQHPQAFLQQVRQHDQTQPPVASPYFNGAALGTRNKRMTGTVGVLTDPSKQNWVKEQQEKYLRFHMRLYRTRGK